MKALKILFFVVFLVVVVVVGGIAAFIGFADPNDFKETIATKVRDATGRELALEGDLEWGFWPKIYLKAGSMSLSNAAGFGDEPFFAADRFEFAVATLPLLGSRVEMDTVVLHGLVLNVQKDASGATNYDDLVGGEAQEDESRGGLAGFVLGGVDIADARISYRDASTGQEATISNLAMQTGPLTIGEPVDFSLTLTAVANQPALDSDLALTGTVSYNLDDEHYVISPLALNALLRGDHLPGGQTTLDFGAEIDVNMDAETATISGLSLEGLGTSVAGEFAATDIKDEKPSATGKLSVDGKDLAAIFNAFELPVGKQLAGVSERGFDFKLAFDADMDSGDVVVSQLDGHMLGATLGGNFTASKADTDKPSAKGTLSASGPDLPTLLAVLGQLQGADAETLKSLDAALRGARDKSFAIKADLDANLAEGQAALPVLEAKLLGNTISGRFNATNADTDKPAVKGTLKAEGPDFPTLLTAVATLQGADAKTLKGLSAGLKGAADKSFSVSADVDADMKAGTAKLPKLDARLLGNTITGEVSATNINDKPAAKGSLKASGKDLAALLAIASQFSADGQGLRDMGAALAKEKNKAFDVELGFDADMGAGRIKLDKLDADLLGLAVTGGLTGTDVDFEKGRGSLDGSLKVASQDLGTLLRTVGQGDLAKSVRTLDLDAGIKGSLSDLSLSPLSVTAKIVSPEVNKPVDLKLTTGQARANLDKDTLTVRDLKVTGLGLNATANLDAEKISEAPSFSGDLEVPAFNLRSFLASLNKPQKTADPKALTRVSLSSKFAGTASSIKLDDVQIGLDETSIKGNVNVADFEGPNLQFGIGIDRINADRYMEPAPAGKTAKPVTPEAAAVGAATELPVETLRALKIKGDLLIGDLVVSGAKMKNVKFSINANNGVIRLKPMGAELYEGKYSGTIVLDAREAASKLHLDTGLANVNVEPLIVDTVGNNQLAGVVNFDAKLRGVGRSTDAMKKSLAGNANFATTNGVFRGVDAVAVLRAVEQIIECKCPVPMPKGGETRFDKLSGTLVAKQGIIRNNDLTLSGDGFLITGKGTLANLHDNTTKFDLTLAVPEQAKGTGGSAYNLGGYDVPIKCRGSLESPSCLPDAGGIVKAVAESAVKKEVGKKIKDAVGGEAGEVLEKLFKF
ncbi:MAG: AsmA family protein [Gammaproteobacteria bacterium]